MTKRAPCIVCGKRWHDAEAHQAYRKESWRARSLLRSRWPALRGLEAVIAHYGGATARPTQSAGEWRVYITRSGEVLHGPLKLDENATT